MLDKAFIELFGDVNSFSPGTGIITGVISLGVRVALAYLLAGPIGEVGIWAAIPIGWALADVTGYGYYLLRRTRLLPEE